MKKVLLTTVLLFALLLTPSSTFAQGMPVPSAVEGTGTQSVVSDGHTAREEAEGKEIWEKLQAKEVTCENLSDEDFGSLGEYFMGQMAGEQHEAMNNMMIQMMGEEGEEQMHVAMGKRMSSCDPDRPMPQVNGGMMTMMMNMMMGSAGSPQVGGGGNPMPALSGVEGMGYGGWNGFGLLGWLPMILFWILLILGVVALVRYLGGTTRDGNKGRSPLDILKERYAKGEIDKKEYEQMKKELE